MITHTVAGYRRTVSHWSGGGRPEAGEFMMSERGEQRSPAEGLKVDGIPWDDMKIANRNSFSSPSVYRSHSWKKKIQSGKLRGKYLEASEEAASNPFRHRGSAKCLTSFSYCFAPIEQPMAKLLLFRQPGMVRARHQIRKGTIYGAFA
jgi:hypothetical protein